MRTKINRRRVVTFAYSIVLKYSLHLCMKASFRMLSNSIRQSTYSDCVRTERVEVPRYAYRFICVECLDDAMPWKSIRLKNCTHRQNFCGQAEILQT